MKDEDLIEEAEVEHGSAKALMQQLEGMSPEDPKYFATFRVLGEYLKHHIKEEENELFEQLGSGRSKVQWEELQQQMLTMRESLMAEMGLVEEGGRGARLRDDRISRPCGEVHARPANTVPSHAARLSLRFVPVGTRRRADRLNSRGAAPDTRRRRSDPRRAVRRDRRSTQRIVRIGLSDPGVPARQYRRAGHESRAPMQTLIVFSHLRWDFVYQRPQHLLSRLARDFRVLFFEEPVRGNLTPFLERLSPCRNVEVLRPHTTVDAGGFHDEQLPELQPLLVEYLRDFGIDDYIAWFYTPMALPLLSGLAPRAVIYDCMDELSAFRNAPRQMLQRESALLKRADLVLTGGPSLYEAKRSLHENVHCFPSAVDVEHYAPRAQRDADPVAARLLADIPVPRLGFFGVIDERFDLDLLRGARAAPIRRGRSCWWGRW